MGQMETNFLWTDPPSLCIASEFTSALKGKIVFQCYQVIINVT